MADQAAEGLLLQAPQIGQQGAQLAGLARAFFDIPDEMLEGLAHVPWWVEVQQLFGQLE